MKDKEPLAYSNTVLRLLKPPCDLYKLPSHNLFTPSSVILRIKIEKNEMVQGVSQTKEPRGEKPKRPLHLFKEIKPLQSIHDIN